MQSDIATNLPRPCASPPTSPVLHLLQARVAQSARIQEMAVAQARRQAAELAKAAAAAEREGRAAAGRLAALEAEIAEAQVGGYMLRVGEG